MGAEIMSEPVKKAVAEYERIRAMFLSNDPNAEAEWQKFVRADNGFGICVNVIGK